MKNKESIIVLLKKNRKTLLIIIAGILSIAAIITGIYVCKKMISGAIPKNGTYVCYDMEKYDISYTLKIDNKKYELKISYNDKKYKQSGTVKFKGNKVYLTANDKTITCEYDKSSKTITMPNDNMELKFKKKH